MRQHTSAGVHNGTKLLNKNKKVKRSGGGEWGETLGIYNSLKAILEGIKKHFLLAPLLIISNSAIPGATSFKDRSLRGHLRPRR